METTEPGNSDGGRGDARDESGLLSNSFQTGPDVRLIRRAIRCRWPVSDRIRKLVVDRAEGVVADAAAKTDHVIAVSRLLLDADCANMREEFEHARNQRLDSGGVTERVDHTGSIGDSQRAIVAKMLSDPSNADALRKLSESLGSDE